MNVAIYCASSNNIDRKFFEAAQRIGQLLAEEGYDIINGAGSDGLMAAVTDASLKHGGKVIGIIPSFMVNNNWHHKGLTEMIETPDMHTRQRMMAEKASAVIALAGGIGTLAELSEVICWKQLGIYSMPVIILNTDGYWTPLLQQLKSAESQGFMSREKSVVWQVADTPEEALEIIRQNVR